LQTPFVEAAPPLVDGLWPDTQLGGDFLVCLAVGAAQDDPAALGQFCAVGKVNEHGAQLGICWCSRYRCAVVIVAWPSNPQYVG
jgi:hypothetical protein